MAKRVWDNYELIADVQKTQRELIRVAAATRDGFRLIVIRQFYYHKGDDMWKPGRDGIVIPLMSFWKEGKEFKSMLTFNKFVEALTDAYEVAATMDLADPEKGVYSED